MNLKTKLLATALTLYASLLSASRSVASDWENDPGNTGTIEIQITEDGYAAVSANYVNPYDPLYSVPAILRHNW